MCTSTVLPPFDGLANCSSYTFSAGGEFDHAGVITIEVISQTGGWDSLQLTESNKLKETHFSLA